MARLSKAWSTPLVLAGSTLAVLAASYFAFSLLMIFLQISSGKTLSEISAGAGFGQLAFGPVLLAGGLWLLWYGRRLKRMVPSYGFFHRY
jgi:hypothetical protein